MAKYAPKKSGSSYSKFYRKQRGKQYLSRRKRPSGVSYNVKRYVRNAIHRNAENKFVITYFANQPIESGNRSLITWSLINGTVQGDADNNRVGNSIRVVQGLMRFTVNLLPYNITTNPNQLPVWVKVWVVRDLRITGQLTSIDSTSFSKFFRESGGSIPMQNNPLDLTLEVNPDMFRVLYSRMFKLGGAGVSNTSNNPVNSYSYFDNSPTAKIVTINWARWCKKQLKYDDNYSSLPINANLYLVIQPVYADGSDSTSKRPVEFHYTNTMKFEDL